MSATALAPYPASQYPASSFFGAASLRPGGANAADDNHMTPQAKRQIVIAVAVIVLVGYVLFHYNYVR